MDKLLLINKQKGMSSHDVVYKVRKILNEKKVGHAGTLDPNATGLLLIMVGSATKMSEKLMQHNKEYVATLKLGETTTTLDEEGEITHKKPIDETLFNEEKIEEVLKTFLGKQLQIPPIYSAIKINGRKLYEYARSGKEEEIEIKPREIEIFDIFLNYINTSEDTIEFTVNCSKGTYIRTLCSDIAIKLNTVGYMKELVRTKINDYLLKDAITIEELK